MADSIGLVVDGWADQDLKHRLMQDVGSGTDMVHWNERGNVAED